MKIYRYHFEKNSLSQELVLSSLFSSQLTLILFKYSPDMISCKIQKDIQSCKTCSLSFSNLGSFICDGFSFYAGILYLVLCRQQIYVLKSLTALIIIQLLLVLVTLIWGLLILVTSHRPYCETTDDFCKHRRREYDTAEVFGILSIIIYLLLLIVATFNWVITIRQWRARNRASNNNSNSYLLTSIPLLLRNIFRKTAIAYIVMGLLLVGLDVGLMLNEYPFR